LSSIRTTAIVPVDLNAFLYGLETALAASGDPDAATVAAQADRRRAAMHKHLWNATDGYFADFDLELDCLRPLPSAAALAPLLAGLATADQAEATARFTRDRLLAPGGLRSTLVNSGQQWDSPNGWAPLQWIAVAGLRRYGHEALANEIARRWISTVEATYARTGLLYEKYNVETPAIGYGGEYEPQVGFGWTNGVTADLIDDQGWRPQ
jgi:alpha,alpha-trehalase